MNPIDTSFAGERERWDRRVLKAALLVSIPLYFVALFMGRELGFNKYIEGPLVSASILYLLVSLDKLVAVWRDSARGRVELRTYETAAEFYLDLAARVLQARRRVWTTYLRPVSIQSLGPDAETYFRVCEQWAARDPAGHAFRRIVIRPEGLGMEGMLEIEQKRNRRPNYTVRVAKNNTGDAISMAVVDDDIVFVTFVVERDEFKGFSCQSRELGSLFQSYHSLLWQTGVDVGDYVASGASAQQQR
ncbi:hypothetical protein [Micromonospora chokoriensis]|uniref:hypothetical protein n=1 Tax=Micromonospora chokoriensis TaxID=356851 RepID=UPI0004C3A972|nr:hypothetical protein [Micromonospora chokoriensis]